MHDSAAKFRTAKSFYTHEVSDYDHPIRTRKHARNYSLQVPAGHYSPQWWKPSPTKSHSPVHHHDNGDKSDQSRESRIEAIAEGQKKLMEMAREMPESSQELSMRDLVEVEVVSQDNVMAGDKYLLSNGADMQRKMEDNTRMNNNSNGNHKKVTVDRTLSAENGGHLLKMAFPFSVGSKKKTKKNVHPSSSNDGSIGRESPKPFLLDDKEWGKVRSGESEYGGSNRYSASKSSSDSAHSHANNMRGQNEGGCWSFLCTGERHGRGHDKK